MKISFIGAGNVSWHLSQALENAGHGVEEVFSRNIDNAEDLTKHLYDAKVQRDLNFSKSIAQVFFLCVTDDSMIEVVKQLVLPENAMLVHTSGSKSLEELDELLRINSDVSIRTGVFYPLQTFTKNFKIDFAEVPICIESEDETVEKALIDLGQDISDITYVVNSEERRVLHVAAVFACNFTNHLLALAKSITDSEDLEFDLLKPLIRETFRKALAAENPVNVQTGPAIRGDETTINRHLEYLKEDENLVEIYEVLTESIMHK